jgi:hypothetical protein
MTARTVSPPKRIAIAAACIISPASGATMMGAHEQVRILVGGSTQRPQPNHAHLTAGV